MVVVQQQQHPQDTLPDGAPLATFFMPNILGAGFAFLLEKVGLESILTRMLPTKNAHPYCLLGLGIFCLANCNSYLGGSVVLARIAYNVPNPNLYATTGNNKHAVEFNCVQRGHQNFLEQYGQLALVVFFTAMVANRPNIAGVLLVVVSMCRVLYAQQYRTNVKRRMGPFLGVVFVTSIGVGYALLVGLSAFGIQCLRAE